MPAGVSVGVAERVGSGHIRCQLHGITAQRIELNIVARDELSEATMSCETHSVTIQLQPLSKCNERLYVSARPHNHDDDIQWRDTRADIHNCWRA